MKRIYACLAGKWVELTSDSFAYISSEQLKPIDWFEKLKETNSKLPNLILVRYQSILYWINPIFIQAEE